MDLSKAFDCLPHFFIIDKLSAYGLSDTACSFLHSNLLDRKQMVKLEQHYSSWLNTIKGVPKASIFRFLLFNIFVNDIFFFVSVLCLIDR